MSLANQRISAGQRTGGFTLIELLVTIAVIAILAGLVLPALSRGKALAGAAKCKSNLHQIGLGLTMYALDNSGAYPVMTYAEIDTPRWEIDLQHYFEPERNNWFQPGRTVLQCPSHRPLLTPVAPGVDAFHPSYGYNVWGNSFYRRNDAKQPLGLGGAIAITGLSGRPVPQIRPTRAEDVQNPGDMIAMGDGYMARGLQGTSGPGDMAECSALGRNAENLLFVPGYDDTRKAAERRHRGLLNMVLCDGHVEEGKIDPWYFSDAERRARRWNIDNVK